MTWIKLARHVGFVTAAAVFALACSDGGPSSNTGSIQVAVNPAALSLSQGGSSSVTVSLTRSGGFTGVVTLAITGLPSGVTTTITPAQLSETAASATVNLTIAATVAPASYTATVSATAQGVGQATTTYQLTVTTAGAIEYQFCDASEAPPFFAYQNGTGAWQVVTGTASGNGIRFGFNLTQGHGGVLAVYRIPSEPITRSLSVGRTPQVRSDLRTRFGFTGTKNSAPDHLAFADVYQTEVIYASTAEHVEIGAVPCTQTQSTKTITGDVVGVPAGSFSVVSLASSTDVVIGGASSIPVTFTGVPAGLVDFAGSRTLGPGTPPNRVLVFRGLNVPDGGSLPSNIDFDGPASSVPAIATATITGGAGENLEIYTDLVTANTPALMSFDLAPSQASTRPWAGLNSALMLSGEFHGLVVVATPPNRRTDFRVSGKYVGPVANQTLALGPSISAPATSAIIGGVYPRFRFQGTLPADYNKGAVIDVLSAQPSGNRYTIVATSTYLSAVGNALVYDFTMPDVVGFAGFPAAARLTTGTNDVAASGFGFTGIGIFGARPAIGTEFKTSVKATAINVQ